MFLKILFLIKTIYKFMTFLEFLNLQQNSEVESINEGFRSSDVAKAHELMLDIFKKKISGGKIIYDKNPVTTNIGNDNCESFTFMKIDDKTITNMWNINYLKSDTSNEVYSIDFFDSKSANEILFGSGIARANLSIYTLGSSVAYFIPIICHVVNNDDYSLNNENANKEASKIFVNSPKNECIEYTYYYGAQKYQILENLDNEIIEEAFNYNIGLVLEASEAQDYRWKVKKERDEAYKNRKEDPERHERLRQEYEEIVNAIRGGATSIKDLRMAIKHDMLVSFDGEGVDEAQREIDAERDDPKTAFKKMGVYIKSVIKGLQPGVILCGAPGIGKTYRVKQYLKAYGYVEGHNLYTIKGTQSPRQLYIDMYNYKDNGKIIVIDDADALVGPKAPEVAINLLKAALDSTSDDEGRLVAYKVTGDLVDEEGMQIPKRHYYNGQMIIITNYSIGQLNTALKGRVFTQTLDFTSEQILEIIRDLIPNLDPHKLTMEAKQKAYNYLMKLAEEKTTMEINIRNFLSCARIYTLCKDEDLDEKDVESMIKEQMVNQSMRGGKSF